MRTLRSVLLGVLALVANACAGVSSPPPPPSPEEIPGLEAALGSDPADADLGLLLTSAYREAGRIDDATRLVDDLRVRHPSHTGLKVMDGLLRESGGDFVQARALYEDVLSTGPRKELADELRRRLQVIRLEELRAEVRRALDRESELTDTPDPATVGVFPFVYTGGDPQWEPLRLALAELLMTDLAITGRLRVVERVKVQALLQEVALAESGRVEESTAARSGRILGSGHIVQGRFSILDSGRISVEAAVVKVAAGVARIKPITAEDEITRLFDLEKQLALDIHAELGIQLTPAERARVNERQTESVQALLAFGRGLAASDAGDFAEAERQFEEAAQIDPAFGLATGRRELSRARSSSAPRALQSLAALTAHQRQAVMAIRNAPASARARILSHMNRKQRAVLAEVLGQDRLGTTILLELIFRRPGGGP